VFPIGELDPGGGRISGKSWNAQWNRDTVPMTDVLAQNNWQKVLPKKKRETFIDISRNC
jgi:hypothetical protein